MTKIELKTMKQKKEKVKERTIFFFKWNLIFKILKLISKKKIQWSTDFK